MRHSTNLAEIICQLKRLSNLAENLSAAPGTKCEELRTTFKHILSYATDGLIEATLEEP